MLSRRMQCRIILSKGAPEIMLPLCSNKLNEDSSVSVLTEEERGEIVETLQRGGER